MDVIHKLLHSMRFAFAFGAVMVAIVSWLAFAFVGWLGIGLVGLMGLYVSTRIDLMDGHAVADFDYGASSVNMLARQVEQQQKAAPSQREQNEKDRRIRKALIYLMNTLWLAMMGLGFAMFSVYQV